MADFVHIANMPVVIDIIRKTEAKIKAITGKPVSLKIVSAYTSRATLAEAIKQVVKQTVCAEYKVEWVDVIGVSRKPPLPAARKAYCFIMCDHLKQSSVRTGDDLLMDHSTVLVHCKTVKGYIDVNDDEARRIKRILFHIDAHITVLENEWKNETETIQSATAGTGTGA